MRHSPGIGLGISCQIMTESNTSLFIRGMLSTGIGKFSIVLLGFLGLMLTTRYVTEEELGTFILLTAIIQFLNEFSSIGLHLSVPKYMASIENVDEKRVFIKTVLSFRIVLVILTGIIALLIVQALSKLFGGSLQKEVVIFVPIILVAESLGAISLAIFQGSFRFKTLALVSIVQSTVNFVGILVFVLWLNAGLMGLVFARLFSRIATVVVCILSSQIDLRWEFDYPVLKKLVKYGIPLQSGYVLAFIYQRVDTFIIGIMMGMTQIAYYEIAKRIPEALSEFYDVFIKVYFPFTSKLYDDGNQKEMARMMNTSTRVLTFLTLFGALIVSLFGAEILTILFSERYISSLPAFAILMVGLTFTVIDSTLGYTLVGIGDAAKTVMFNLVRMVVVVVLYFVLIPNYGIVGVALSGVLGIASVNVLYILMLRKRGVQARAMDYLKPLIIFGFALLISQVLSDAYWLRVTIILLYVAANMVLSVVTFNDISVLAKTLKSILIKRVANSSL